MGQVHVAGPPRRERHFPAASWRAWLPGRAPVAGDGECLTASGDPARWCVRVAPSPWFRLPYAAARATWAGMPRRASVGAAAEGRLLASDIPVARAGGCWR